LFYALVNGWFLGQWGDYGSCLMDTTNGTYVLANITGVYQGDYRFPRGGQGKFVPYSTVMGLCVPNVCTDENLEKRLSNTIIRMANNSNWTNVSVSYYFASEDNADLKSAWTNGFTTMISILLAFIFFGVISLIINISRLGDKSNLNYTQLDKL